MKEEFPTPLARDRDFISLPLVIEPSPGQLTIPASPHRTTGTSGLGKTGATWPTTAPTVTPPPPPTSA
jgi:hypothetical protein